MSARFSGVAVTLFFDKNRVQAWLPQGLQLADGPWHGEHPVILLFGTQTDLTRQKLVTRKLRFGRCYHETFVIVPDLKLQSRPRDEPVFHVVRIYLNSRRATIQGIRRFGWPKICTDIEARGPAYRILGPCGETLLAAQTDYRQLAPVDPKNDSLRQIQRILSQPLVLERRGSLDRYDFDLHLATATIRSVSVQLQVCRGFSPQLGPLKAAIPGINRQAFGAFHIDCCLTKVAAD